MHPHLNTVRSESAPGSAVRSCTTGLRTRLFPSLEIVTLGIVTLGLVFVGSGGAVQAGSQPTVEIKVGKELYTGKIVAHQADVVYLFGQDGEITQLKIDTVGKFRQVSPRFEGWPASTMVTRLKKELGSSFSIATSRHYIVCAPDEKRARSYVNLFEDVYRSFHLYFSVRGFSISDPECPLVAIVFPNQAAFNKYAATDKVRISKGLKGYYHPSSNRIALYEEQAAVSGVSPDGIMNPWTEISQQHLVQSNPFLQPVQEMEWAGSIDGDLQDTMVHEATHQIAFNVGLHARLGANPRWVVEGLATVFEAPGIRGGHSSSNLKSRLNPERQAWFVNFAKNRRKSRTLAQFLAEDRAFDTQTLDAYSEAWALSFYLVEKRPRDYAKYLARISKKDPLKEYTSQQRVADFEQTISKDLNLIEAEYIRFITSLK